MNVTTRIHRSIAEIPPEQWAEVTASHPTPVFDWSWLHLLETAGGLNPTQGWTPLHVALWRGPDLIAVAPLYGRSDSWGDFVYDFAFAEAIEGRGGRWYPKLVGMCPATPTTGWRVFVRPGEPQAYWEEQWFAAAEALGQRLGVVSLQLNFTEPAWSDGLPGRWHRWSHQNFLWANPGHTSFEDYLAEFDKNQRRNIRRERQSLSERGITVKVVPGEEIPSDWFPLMGRLYDKTNDQFGPWAAKFLQPGFFESLDRLRHLLLFSATFREPERLPLALGFLLQKGGHLVGRYWGQREEVSDQYFNVCYYAPIEEAIRQGWSDFDPGAGSELKVRRGFRSLKNVSLHRFFDQGAEQLFTAHVRRLSHAEENRIEALNQALPFSKREKNHRQRGQDRS